MFFILNQSFVYFEVWKVSLSCWKLVLLLCTSCRLNFSSKLNFSFLEKITLSQFFDVYRTFAFNHSTHNPLCWAVKARVVFCFDTWNLKIFATVDELVLKWLVGFEIVAVLLSRTESPSETYSQQFGHLVFVLQRS